MFVGRRGVSRGHAWIGVEGARMTQQPAKSQEPSMEEILASIRRIIADDDATKSAPKPDEAVRPPPAPDRPVPPPAPAPRVPDPSLSAAPEVDAESTGASVADQSADILDLTESMAQ